MSRIDELVRLEIAIIDSQALIGKYNIMLKPENVDKLELNSSDKKCYINLLNRCVRTELLLISVLKEKHYKLDKEFSYKK